MKTQDMTDPTCLLKALRVNAATAFARERLASLGQGDGDEELVRAWGRADAVARTILDGSREAGDGWARARYEALLWLDGGVDGTLRDAELPGSVSGSLEAVSVVGLVATVETIDGLAEITRIALSCAENAATAERALAASDPDASYVLGLLAALSRGLAASAADRLDAHEPITRDSARQRAGALLAQSLSNNDPGSMERAGMIAMRAGLKGDAVKR